MVVVVQDVVVQGVVVQDVVVQDVVVQAFMVADAGATGADADGDDAADADAAAADAGGRACPTAVGNPGAKDTHRGLRIAYIRAGKIPWDPACNLLLTATRHDRGALLGARVREALSQMGK
jgi:hypothetical protein